MATFFELPPIDVLFKHVFNHLEASDVWRLRLTCRKLHELCWDYFRNVCKSLKIILAPEEQLSRESSSVDVGAGIGLMQTCKHLQSLEISGLYGAAVQTKLIDFHKLLDLLAEGKTSLKCFKLKCLNLSATSVAVLECLSANFCCLCELELCDITMEQRSVQQVLSRMLFDSRNTLHTLALYNLSFSPNQPLPIQFMKALRHFSVAHCHNLSSECCLEEVFRKCPLLEVVDLRGVNVVCDRTIMVLVEYCRVLKQVSVRHCPLVSSTSLCRLASQGIRLDIVCPQDGVGTTEIILGQI